MQLEKAYLDNFCKKLEDLGWKRVEPRSFEHVLFLDVFRKKIKEINPQVFEEFEEEKVFPQLLSLLQNSDEAKILEILRYGATIILKKWNSLIPVTVHLIDYEDIENNEFFYVREQEFIYGRDRIVPDIVLYVNGIPLVVIEGKNPLKPTVEKQYIEGLKQIMRYQKENPELFKFVQLGIAAAENNPYIPTFPQKEVKDPTNYSFWKEQGKENIFYLLQPKVLLEFVQYFLFFTRDKRGERTKIAARYMQYYATKKAIKRVSGYIEGTEKTNKGLIWHWQGSGKTYTMFFIANMFLHLYQNKRALVFFVIDRLELQRQLSDILKSIEHKKLGDVKIVEKIEELQNIINNAEKEWGLKIITIQKFQTTKIDLSKRVKKKEVLILIDEAHRSQYGDLAATMRRIFKNACFIGFTGTPVFKKERNTFKHFANLPDELYLDVYFIRESQKDGFTLPLTYRLIEEKAIDIMLKPEEIKTIVEYYAEKEDKKKEDEIEKILMGETARVLRSRMSKYINQKKLILTNPKRIEKIVKYIKKNIESDTENFKFKAMVVAANRKACIIYKKLMDKYFSPEFSEVVMSYQFNETDNKINEFHKTLLTRWDAQNDEEANKKIIEKFLKEENPKVLIVTDMLLTGFDAPILKVMYLDKVMFHHKLLQAIARVNRPYPQFGKKKGLIIDSVGLFQHLRKTLGIYELLADAHASEIKRDLENLLTDSKKEVKILRKNIQAIKEKLKNISGIDVDTIKEKIEKNDFTVAQELEEKISYMALLFESDENVREIVNFLKKDVLELYKSLGAEPEKIDYLWDVKVLSIIYYRFIKKIRKPKARISKEMWDSIMDWIYRSTIVDDLLPKFEKELEGATSVSLPTYSIIADHYFSIKSRVENYLMNPLYKEIYEKIKRLYEMWMNRNIGVEEFLRELKRVDKQLKRYKKIEEQPLWVKISNFIKIYLKNKHLKVPSLKSLESKIKEIQNKRRFLETDKKAVRVEIAKIVFTLDLPIKEKLSLEKELTELVLNELKKVIL